MNENYVSRQAVEKSADLCAARKASPCDDAYAALADAQANEEGAINALLSRLGVVLRDPQPEAPNPATDAAPAPQSEMHGRLLAATSRARNNADELRRAIDRLTI